jgi:hypothetical protein
MLIRFVVILFYAVGLIFLSPLHLQACSPTPDSVPRTLLERFERAEYVLVGNVVSIDGETIQVAVNEYFKGQGPQEVNISGFNSHSCSDYVEINQDRIFFAQGDPQTGLEAVYDGAFGSSMSTSEENLQQLKIEQQQNRFLQQRRVNCAVRYDGTKLSLPCIKVTGQEQLYSASLNLVADQPVLLFGVTQVEQILQSELIIEQQSGIRFKLVKDQVASIDNRALLIELTGITEDSRCPSDVNCVWSGQVSVSLKVSLKGQAEQLLSFTLTGKNDQLAQQKIAGYVIEVLEVSPYSVTTKPIAEDEYVVALMVTKL